MDQNMLNAIEQLKRGEEAGFNYIYSETYKFVYKQARGHLKNEEDIQDVVQNVYLSVYRSIHSLQDPNAFYGWLKTIVRNQAIMTLRKFKDEVSYEEGTEGKLDMDQLTSVPVDTLPEANMEQKETGRIMMELISDLPELQKSALYMYYYENMKVEEIAEAMGCSTGTIKSRLNYARKRIGEQVEEIEKRDGIRLHVWAIPTIILAFKLLSEKPVKAMAAEGMLESVNAAAQVASASASKAAQTVIGIDGSPVMKNADGNIVRENNKPTLKLGKNAESVTKKALTPKSEVVKTVESMKTAEAVQETVQKTGGVFAKLAGLSLKAKAAMVAGALVVGGGAVAIPTLVSEMGEDSSNIEVSVTPGEINEEVSDGIPTVTPTLSPTATPTPTTTPYVMSDAEQLTLENLRYEIDGGEVSVLGLADGSSLTEVVIPPVIEGRPVTRIRDAAFSRCHITSVVFPETLSEIGSMAFYETHIKEVYIPNGVTKFGTKIFTDSWVEKVIFAEGHTMIPTGCFERCSSLKEVVLPSTLRIIESGAFLRCGFTEIVFPEGLETIGKEAFYGCEGLEEIVLPDSVTEVGEGAFQNCKNAKRLVLSKKLKVISNRAFNAMSSLVTVDIPEGVERIEGVAFRFCVISDVNLPTSLKYIDDTAFAQDYGCNPMESVSAPSGSYAEEWAIRMGHIGQ